MVSFSCEACGDVLAKKKLDLHSNRCHGASFTCLDCMVHFSGVEYRSHTSCITEDQKYQGALYKEKKQKANKMPKDDHKTLSLQPYVEDVGEDGDYAAWTDFAGHTEDDRSPADPPPEAPTPPSAAACDVFDFLVATGQTPNASTAHLPRQDLPLDADDARFMRYKYTAEDFLDPSSLMDAEQSLDVEYGSGPVHNGSLVTPASKAHRRRAKASEASKDKKRKRLHVDVPADQVMTDAPPVVHSNLTDNLKGLMRQTLPPSPDYSGADVADNSPASPLKKSKHTKHAKNGHSIFGVLAGSGKLDKTQKKKKTSKAKSEHRRKEQKESKLIEFRPQSKDGKKRGAHDGQMIVFKPRANAFLDFVTKGPESARGCSMNKALKRYHRERGADLPKSAEEKELWKDLRLRRNDRDEIVIFSL
ncbi:hypothetical protein L249_3591 [Ophiocordyceps polyrhachis-furcata BCC 54312]|uniref:Zinc finger C2H2 LYAR-type domain-containing protein n=1 Tax=Ophiocordyceps polyrhachis-furcata BCC 54312 TaxID=1330021 RepID=A0A367LMP7_9HYPO|nr:hypothetical protein L249_3591 [Ophiocordyceps polyrhachis-furcata BCC 54312]